MSEITSLDEFDNKDIYQDIITVILKTRDDYLVNISYPLVKFQGFLNCNICKNITSGIFEKQKTLDLSEFRYENFTLLLDYLETGKYPILSKNIDYINLYQLALYLGLDDGIIEYLNFDTETRFYNSLTDYDYKIVTEELELRKMLYKNEEKNFKYLDGEYELFKVASDLKLPEHAEDKTYINRGNIHKITKIDQYYGLKSYTFFRDYKNRDRISESFFIMIRNLLYNVKDTNPVKIIKKAKIYRYTGAEYFPKYVYSLYLLLLKNFSYNNFVVAGGFIYFKDSYASVDKLTSSTDIDIFLVTKDYNEAINIIRDIYNVVYLISRETEDEKVIISVNGNALNLMIPIRNKFSPQKIFYLNVQIILRLYNSIAQVISGFDIDACCIAYDGSKFYGMPRFVRSLKLEYNLVDPERQSTTYSLRLLKYWQRGFDVVFPGINPEYITCNFMDDYWKYSGIAKIITYFNTKRAYSDGHTESGPDYEISPYLMNLEGLYKVARKTAIGHFYQKYIEDQTPSKQILDLYDKIKIYFSPTWEELDNAEGKANFASENKYLLQYIADNKLQIPVLFSYNLDYILDRKENVDNGLPDVLQFESSIPEKLEFKTKNAGTQLTNSFNPTMEDWYIDLYMR